MTNSVAKPALYAFAILLASALLSCGGSKEKVSQPNEPTMEFSGLSGYVINQFHVSTFDDSTYAVTDKGLFLLEDDKIWLSVSPQDWHVNDMALLYPEYLIASIKVDGENHLVESLDNGQTWEFIQHDFGGPDIPLEDGGSPIYRLTFDTNSGLLYAVGQDVLAQSDDFGRHWQKLSGEWDSFGNGHSSLTIHPGNTHIWFGGQGALENPVLRHFDPNTAITTNHPQISELLEHPSVIKSISLFEDEPQRVMASGEGGIIQSTDYGNSWQSLLVNHNSRFYFNAITHPEEKSMIYTAGWDKDFESPQTLILEVSEDGGTSWHQHKHADPQLMGGVWSMAIRQEAEEYYLYLGLYKGGVYKVDLSYSAP